MQRHPRLSRAEWQFLDELPSPERPYLSVISLWEAAMHQTLGKITFLPSFDTWLDLAVHQRTVRLLQVTLEIAKEIPKLPASFHGDPADRILAATCRVLNLPLMTHDHRMIRSRAVRIWHPI